MISQARIASRVNPAVVALAPTASRLFIRTPSVRPTTQRPLRGRLHAASRSHAFGTLSTKNRGVPYLVLLHGSVMTAASRPIGYHVNLHTAPALYPGNASRSSRRRPVILSQRPKDRTLGSATRATIRSPVFRLALGHARGNSRRLGKQWEHQRTPRISRAKCPIRSTWCTPT